MQRQIINPIGHIRASQHPSQVIWDKIIALISQKKQGEHLKTKKVD